MKKFLYWLPRILAILAIAFLTMFSLDVFEPGTSIWYQLAGFVVHSIPSIILIILLIIAWRRPKVGGIAFLVVGAILAFIVWFLAKNAHDITLIFRILNSFILAGPIFLVGILFYIEGKK